MHKDNAMKLSFPTFGAVTALLLLTALPAWPARADEAIRIRLVVSGRTLDAVLDDSAAGRSFSAMLPLTLTLEDFNGTEKIGYLPQRLPRDGAAQGCEPSAGDLTYYAPWGNLAIFYRDYSWSRDLIPLGRITSDMTPLTGAKDGTVLRIERAD